LQVIERNSDFYVGLQRNGKTSTFWSVGCTSLPKTLELIPKEKKNKKKLFCRRPKRNERRKKNLKKANVWRGVVREEGRGIIFDLLFLTPSSTI
jgi:hypothetical protein